MVHGLNEGHIAPYTDIEFQLAKYQTCNSDSSWGLFNIQIHGEILHQAYIAKIHVYQTSVNLTLNAEISLAA